MLTREDLKTMEPEHVFAWGAGTYPEIYKDPILWLAVRGMVDDWTMYYKPLPKEYIYKNQIEDVRINGDKIHDKNFIKNNTRADDEAMRRYRD